MGGSKGGQMSYRLMLFHCYDPPEPPEECKHGINRHHFCESCDDDIDYDNIRDERKDSENN